MSKKVIIGLGVFVMVVICLFFCTSATYGTDVSALTDEEIIQDFLDDKYGPDLSVEIINGEGKNITYKVYQNDRLKMYGQTNREYAIKHNAKTR